MYRELKIESVVHTNKVLRKIITTVNGTFAYSNKYLLIQKLVHIRQGRCGSHKTLMGIYARVKEINKQKELHPLHLYSLKT